jgi:dCTP deaminase
VAFWRGERLAQVLPGLIQPFEAKNLDCASYRLSVGDQAFVTSDKFASSAPSEPLISALGSPPNHTLRIRPGQFAFLLTEEVVKVPNDAMALISMRARYKFKGLINVSGFHVDPGWEGKLLFSVYNAGPTELIIHRGEPLFLIVFADLDAPTDMTYGASGGKSQGQAAIDTTLLQNMTEQVFSPLMLQRRMGELQRSLENTKMITYTVSSVAALVLAAVAIYAQFAPTTLGVIMARTIDGAGYDLRLKGDLADRAPATPVMQIQAQTPQSASASAAVQTQVTSPVSSSGASSSVGASGRAR